LWNSTNAKLAVELNWEIMIALAITDLQHLE